MSGTETSARLGLPLLAAGQAQKEVTHNEALALLDLAVQPSVVAIGLDGPPASPVAGECWVIGAAPTGAWAGHAHAIAGWTAGGWRFVEAAAGMTVARRGDGVAATFVDGAWRVGVLAGLRVTIGGQQVVGARGGAVAEPTGGSVVDQQSRNAVAAILRALRAHGLIAG